MSFTYIKTEEDLGLTLVEPRKKYQQLMNRCLRHQQAAVYQKDMTYPSQDIITKASCTKFHKKS
ncbi:hypothetical protein DPMN_176680 [Dreissena polymorpha]|uniref:Uncharacterized protein n=1 Tax=Dreissena polymorpha TaxID=45954 RepID=A0A9D4IJG2_DREPO|nr:hypothetical protein DPMN_176680 [Dreissena polymorpha]